MIHLLIYCLLLLVKATLTFVEISYLFLIDEILGTKAYAYSQSAAEKSKQRKWDVDHPKSKENNHREKLTLSQTIPIL